MLEVEDFVSDGDVVLFQFSLGFFIYLVILGISYVILKHVEYIIITENAALRS